MMLKKNPLEWIVFAASLAVIAVVAAILAYAGMTADDRPPSIVVELRDPQNTGTGFAVPLEVRNDGDTTAEAVEVEVVLVIGSSEERGRTVLEFVPHRSSRRAWVTFTQDPARGRLAARVLGYREP